MKTRPTPMELKLLRVSLRRPRERILHWADNCGCEREATLTFSSVWPPYLSPMGTCFSMSPLAMMFIMKPATLDQWERCVCMAALNSSYACRRLLDQWGYCVWYLSKVTLGSCLSRLSCEKRGLWWHWLASLGACHDGSIMPVSVPAHTPYSYYRPPALEWFDM